MYDQFHQARKTVEVNCRLTVPCNIYKLQQGQSGIFVPQVTKVLVSANAGYMAILSFRIAYG